MLYVVSNGHAHFIMDAMDVLHHIGDRGFEGLESALAVRGQQLLLKSLSHKLIGEQVPRLRGGEGLYAGAQHVRRDAIGQCGIGLGRGGSGWCVRRSGCLPAPSTHGHRMLQCRQGPCSLLCQVRAVAKLRQCLEASEQHIFLRVLTQPFWMEWLHSCSEVFSLAAAGLNPLRTSYSVIHVSAHLVLWAR